MVQNRRTGPLYIGLMRNGFFPLYFPCVLLTADGEITPPALNSLT